MVKGLATVHGICDAFYFLCMIVQYAWNFASLSYGSTMGD